MATLNQVIFVMNIEEHAPTSIQRRSEELREHKGDIMTLGRDIDDHEPSCDGNQGVMRKGACAPTSKSPTKRRDDTQETRRHRRSIVMVVHCGVGWLHDPVERRS